MKTGQTFTKERKQSGVREEPSEGGLIPRAFFFYVSSFLSTQVVEKLAGPFWVCGCTSAL